MYSKNIKGPKSNPEARLICYLLWSDPERNSSKLGPNWACLIWSFCHRNIQHPNPLQLSCGCTPLTKRGFSEAVLVGEIPFANFRVPGVFRGRRSLLRGLPVLCSTPDAALLAFPHASPVVAAHGRYMTNFRPLTIFPLSLWHRHHPKPWTSVLQLMSYLDPQKKTPAHGN